MDGLYQNENEYGLEEDDNDKYSQEPMVNAGELKNLSNQIEQFMSMIVTKKVVTEQRMARLEQPIMDNKKPLITPKPAVLRPTVPTSAEQPSIYIAETVMHKQKPPARRESIYEAQVKKFEQANQIADQPLRLVQVAKEDNSYRLEHISIASKEVFEDRMLQMQDDISLSKMIFVA